MNILNASDEISILDCQKEKFGIAWQEKIGENIKSRQEFIDECKRKLSTAVSRIELLEAKLFFEDDQFENVISSLQNSRKTIILDYQKSIQGTEDFEVDKYFYLQLLKYSAFSNYMLKNYRDAIPDFELYLKENKELLFMQLLASSYSYEGFTSKSIDTLKEAYKLEPVDDTAFYLASVYAKNRQFKESMYWLHKVSSTSSTKIIEWIRSDENFNSIRDYPEFKKFLESLEK